jgi:hypothetical protein
MAMLLRQMVATGCPKGSSRFRVICRIIARFLLLCRRSRGKVRCCAAGGARGGWYQVV